MLKRNNAVTTLSLLTLTTFAAGAQPATNASAQPVVTNPVSTGSPVNHSGSFGIGPLLGEPIGATMKVWLNGKMAVDAAAGWSSVEPDGFQLHADFLYHATDLIHVDQGLLPLYFGVGGRVKFPDEDGEDTRAGVRLPLGLAYLFANQPLEIFAEIAPVIDFTPSTRLEWNGGIGVRFYFR